MSVHAQLGERPTDRRPASHTLAHAPSAATWLKLAVLYLLLSVVLGMAMGSSKDFTLRSVHVHMSLMGWTTLALAGLVYGVFPDAGASRLARLHFWLYNLGLPPMMVSLSALMLGHARAMPWLAGSQIVATAGLVAFAANLFLNLTEAPPAKSTVVDPGRLGRRPAGEPEPVCGPPRVCSERS